MRSKSISKIQSIVTTYNLIRSELASISLRKKCKKTLEVFVIYSIHVEISQDYTVESNACDCLELNVRSLYLFVLYILFFNWYLLHFSIISFLLLIY